MNIDYQTTHIIPTRSYPTYQFHARTASSAPSEDVFRICILESLRWLRSRLTNFTDLPSHICTPEPEDYRKFSLGELSSFSENLGCSIDCVYLEKDGIWTLTISENDMGENIGTKDERLPVQGRRFNTEISFVKFADHVEAGVKTVCSEPVNTEADCKIFRPTFVKKLSENPLVKFRYHFNIDGQTLMTGSRGDAEKLCNALSLADFDMPAVIVCEPEKLKTVKKAADVTETSRTISLPGISSVSAGNLTLNPDMKKSFTSDFSVKFEKKDDRKKKEKAPRGILVDVPKPKQNIKKPEVREQYEYSSQETIDHNSLADSLKCFGFVFYISENCISILNNKLGTELRPGDICVMMHGAVNETIHFSDFKDDPDHLRKRLKNEVRRMLKGAAFTYGNVIFGTDARIREKSENKNENMSLEEQVDQLNQLNKALENKIKELENSDNSQRMNAEELRNVSKKLEAEVREREKAEAAAAGIAAELEKITSSYKNSSFIIDFYRQKSIDAGSFPAEADKVCDWAEKCFSDKIEITARAKSELRKYSGSLDVAVLCDGIYYLNGYARYRLGEISDDELALYGEVNGWEASWCGKGALRVCPDDYNVLHNGNKYTLDLHIKSGIKAQQLIRIYFCWDAAMKKILIGSMPEHLGTAN